MSEKQNIEHDIIYINTMKLLGIICLMIWHTGIKGPNVFVASFFLPLFFFISGYLYKATYLECPLFFIRKRISSLYIPYVVYCSFFLIFNNIFVYLKLCNEDFYIPAKMLGYRFGRILTLMQGLQLAAAMWFVSALFLSSILFCFINFVLVKMVKTEFSDTKLEKIRFTVFFALFLLGSYFSHIGITLPINIDISLVLLFFYYMGFLYNKHEQDIPINLHFALVSFFFILVCTRFGYPQFAQRRYVDPAFVLLCGVSGIYLCLYVSKTLTRLGRIACLNYAGRNTMVILALHFLAFKVVSIIVIQLQDLPVNLLSSFPVIANTNQYTRVCYAVSGLIFPLLGKYIFDIAWCKLKSLLLPSTSEQLHDH